MYTINWKHVVVGSVKDLFVVEFSEASRRVVVDGKQHRKLKCAIVSGDKKFQPTHKNNCLSSQ